MITDFSKYAVKANEFLSDVAEKLGDRDDKARASRVIRAFFHSIRNHITLEENFQLLAQLPLILKGLYVDGWMPLKQKPKSSTKNSFIEEMVNEDRSAGDDFTNPGEVIFSAKAVFGALGKYISKGELEDIKNVLPHELKELVSNDQEAGDAEELVIITITDNVSVPGDPGRNQ